MNPIVIVMEGGLIQGVFTVDGTMPVPFVVIDYDTEGLEPDDIVEVPQQFGSGAAHTARAHVAITGAGEPADGKLNPAIAAWVAAKLPAPEKPEVWVVVSDDERDEWGWPLYWNNEQGWVGHVDATLFSATERHELRATQGGHWVQVLA